MYFEIRYIDSDRRVDVMDEKTKKEKFNTIATNRTNKILDMLRLLGNCSNTSNYSYTDEEVKKIFDAIEKEVKEQKAKFNRKDKKKFSL